MRNLLLRSGKLACLLMILSATANAQLTVSDSLVHTMFGLSTGSITLTIENGEGPYSYHWSTSATTAQISGLGKGDYSVTVIDANDTVIKNFKVHYYVYW